MECLVGLFCRESSGGVQSTRDVFVSNKDAVFANCSFQMVWKDLIRKEEVTKKKGRWNRNAHDA